MKKIGIIGGLTWPSTVDYYRLICTKTNEHFRMRGATPPYPTPNIVIESLNMNETRRLRGEERDEASWRDYDTVFRTTFMRLKTAGAELGLIASNTPHTRLKSITMGLDFPVVSILDATAILVRSLGGKRALILGTAVTMKSCVYTEILKEFGVETFPHLTENETAKLEQLINTDLYQANVGGARKTILDLCIAYVRDPASDVVCLACTELPLAFPEHRNSALFEVNGISFVNTTVAHVDSVLRKAWSS